MHGAERMKYATGVAKWCRRWSEETTTNKISDALTGGDGRCYVINWKFNDNLKGQLKVDGSWYDKVSRLHRQLRENNLPVPSPMANVEMVPPKLILILIWHQNGQDMANLWEKADEFGRLLQYWKLPANCAPDADVGINRYI